MTRPLAQLNEEQLRANRFELISQLADDLAHEIKNPLNAIVINLEVLKVRAGKGDASAAVERAVVIEHEVRRLHHLMDRLLQLLRPDRGEQDSLALDQVLDEVLPLIEAQARLARNEMSVEGVASVYLPVRRDLFKFALLNVLTAVHTLLGEGGGVLKVVCETDADEVRLTIAAVATAGDTRVAQDGSFHTACDTAAALLADGGGRVEAAPSGVTLVVPRTVAV